MVLDTIGEVLEMFKNSFPLSFLFFIPIFIIISPVSPVNAAHEFAAYRMQQYDIHGAHYGCKSALVNMEARPIDAKMITRRCIIVRLQEISISRYRDLIQENAGALMILLPKNLSEITEQEKKNLEFLEKDILSEDTFVPVYFSPETDDLLQIHSDLQSGSSGDQANTAVDALLGAATANGFQIVVNGAQSKSLPDFQITNLQGHLSGFGIEEQLPSIVVVAHYDSFGVAPSLSQGADSNGSGVIALLELSRLFAKLFTNSRTHAKYNLIFLLSGGGKFNYQGTKRWIEDNIDSPDGNLLTDVAYVLCLDSLGDSDQLFLHVSKPPKEGTPGHTFLKNLEDVVKTFFPETAFKMVHKKINLADDMLSWEHERFSVKRLPAFTVSHLESHKSPEKTTILDTRDRVDAHKLSQNIRVIAESLARHLYNLTDQSNLRLFTDALDVQESLVSAWLDQLTAQPRAMQLLGKDSGLLNTLEETMNRYLKDVRRTTLKADKRDPEFMFYDGAKYQMSAYNVKPAIFDLFLAMGIVGYLSVVYFAVMNFHYFYGALRSVTSPKRVKVQ